MAIRELRYNDDPVLRKSCREVEEVNDRVRQLLDDMMDTLHHTESGAALAANQIGILRRLVVIDYCDQYLKLVNPKIIKSEGEQECVEGCLSFPNRVAKTVRPQTVTVPGTERVWGRDYHYRRKEKWLNVYAMSWII